MRDHTKEYTLAKMMFSPRSRPTKWSLGPVVHAVNEDGYTFCGQHTGEWSEIQDVEADMKHVTCSKCKTLYQVKPQRAV